VWFISVDFQSLDTLLLVVRIVCRMWVSVFFLLIIYDGPRSSVSITPTARGCEASVANGFGCFAWNVNGRRKRDARKFVRVDKLRRTKSISRVLAGLGLNRYGGKLDGRASAIVVRHSESNNFRRCIPFGNGRRGR